MKVSDIHFNESFQKPYNTKWSAHTEFGKITVLKRMTGWTNFPNDIETGYTDNDGKFWLALGMFDIRDYPDLELPDAIELIKKNANGCAGI